MAMSASTMANRVITNLKSVNLNIDPTQEALLAVYLTQFCQGIIDEIKASATIQVSGVSTGSGTAIGTVTG